MKFNRGQLLVMAFEGKIKKGDQFKSNTGDIIIFNGHAFVWEDGGQMLRSRMFPLETFERYVPTVSIDLTQKEVNTLAVLTGATGVSDLTQSHKLSRFRTNEVVSDGAFGLYTKFKGLVK
ncbi:hypothetical protein FT641_27085 [Bacillus paranthracis]|uniref:hypothetical protein n=1 Tax=Bacillus paranthracis TaxID=2026186 RepID=UPI001879E8FC|nr:hypothetical protein [Bacillus paranthracis]MBE7117318.1 hypothetical protein [Bacillus paranthracis]MBE7134932.1 hypothetical protein [Bacillus paranthracis]MBE7156341.1 hypothetical protein [Bacillus paranthracis]